MKLKKDEILTKATATPEQVKEIQTLLEDAGYSVGKSGVDGIWGADTTKAIKQYKADTAGSNQYGNTIGNETLKKLSAVNTPSVVSEINKPSTANQMADNYISFVSQYAGERPQYTSPYGEALNNAIQTYNNSNYNDFLNSQAYKDLAKDYTRNGQLAMEDTLGQIAARTGGIASSYASSAAQQAYNDYLNKLNDAARSMYDAERNSQYNNINLLNSLENANYNRYRDLLGDYQNDVSMYGNIYNAGLSADAEAANAEYQSLVDKAETLAQYGDFSGYSALGYTPEEIASMRSGYVAKNTKKSTGSNPKRTEEPVEYDLEGLFQEAYEKYGEDAWSYIKQSGNYKRYGLNSAPDKDDWINWLLNRDESEAGGNESGTVNSGIMKRVQMYLDDYKKTGDTAIADALDDLLSSADLTKKQKQRIQILLNNNDLNFSDWE